MSVTVEQQGMEVSISSHILRNNQLKEKLKSDRLLYKATALDEPVNSSAGQPIIEGDGLSSGSKDSENNNSLQENSVKSDMEAPRDAKPVPLSLGEDVTDEEMRDFSLWLKENKVPALYSPKSKKINIFAENIEVGKEELFYFHEKPAQGFGTVLR